VASLSPRRGRPCLLLLDRVFPGEVLGYGFPRFLEMLHLQGARVKRRWMVVKTLGSAVSLGAGAAVGREGPIAQIGGSIGSAVAQLARLSSEQRRILIACGAAAGIATTFNAPLGALMFAHEIVLLGEVRLVNFTLNPDRQPRRRSSSRAASSGASRLVVPAFSLESYWECFTYAALGVVLGLLAAAYTRLFHAVAGTCAASPCRGRPSCSPGCARSAPWTSSCPGTSRTATRS